MFVVVKYFSICTVSTVCVCLVVLQSEAMPSGSGRKLFKVNNMNNKTNLWKHIFSRYSFPQRARIHCNSLLGLLTIPNWVYCLVIMILILDIGL